MRAFIGIDLDEAARHELLALGESVRAAVPSWRDEKWVAAQNLHLTLRFLGEIESASIDPLSQALTAQLSEYPAFELSCLDPLEAVPGPQRARMLWTRYDDPEERCSRLVRTMDESLLAFGILPEARPFVPHVTLVRARRTRPFPNPEGLSSTLRETVSVREVTLFSSVLGRSGPNYDRVARIALDMR